MRVSVYKGGASRATQHRQQEQTWYPTVAELATHRSMRPLEGCGRGPLGHGGWLPLRFYARAHR
jgi:hypothetical protein